MNDGAAVWQCEDESTWFRSAVVVTPDGKMVISGSSDCTLAVWSLSDGRLLRRLGAVGWSPGRRMTLPDGREGICLPRDGVAAVLQRDTHEVLAVLDGHVAEVTDLAVTPDSLEVASASRDGTVRVWNIASGRERMVLRAPSGKYIFELTISARGDRVAAAAGDGGLCAWDLASGAPWPLPVGNKRDIFCLAFSNDGNTLVSGSDDKLVRVWDLASTTERVCLRGHTEQIRALALTEDGGRVVTASNDATLRVWDLAFVGPPAGPGHAQCVHGAAVSPRGSSTVKAVTVSGDRVRDEEPGSLIVWAAGTGEPLYHLAYDAGSLESVAVTADGRRAVSGAASGRVDLWDLQQGRLLRSSSMHDKRVCDVGITADGRRAVTASFDHTLIVWDLESGALLHWLDGHSNWVNRVVLSNDGRWAASSSADGSIRLWDLVDGRAIGTLPGDLKEAYAMAIHPDGRRLLSGGGDGVVRLWNLADRASAPLEMKGHKGVVTVVGFSADAERAFSGSGLDDRRILVWDLNSGACVHELHGHESYVVAAVLVPDSPHLVSASLDRSVRLWDIDCGLELARFRADSEIHAFALSADGDASPIAVAGDASGRVHFLRLEA